MIIKTVKYILVSVLFIVFIIPIFIWAWVLGLLAGNLKFTLIKVRDIWWDVIEQFDSELKV